MKRTPKEVDSEQLVEQVVNGIREKKGKEIVVLDLRKIKNAVSDFFVICSGDSNTHVDAIGRSVEEVVRVSLRDKPWHVEGTGRAEWVLLDYVNVVVHVFQREPRDYYNIEGLWADAIRTEYDEVGGPVTVKKKNVRKRKET
jgi:ribosome-associated protein